MVRIKKAVICSVLVFVVLFGFSIVTVALAQAPATEQEEEARPTLSASYTFFSQYIWRGYELSKDSLVMFPSITISYKGFGLNVWGDYDTHYEGTDHKEWWETDFVFTYSNNLGNIPRLGSMWDKFKNVNYTIGYIYYDTNADNVTYETNIYRRGRLVTTKTYHPGTGDNEEIYLILSYSMFANPTFSVWRQIEDGEEWYFNFGLSQNFPFPVKCSWAQDWTIDVGTWISYYDREANYEKTAYSAMHDANLWMALNIPLNKYFTLSPTIQYSAPLSNNAKQELEACSFSGDASRFLYGGLVFKVAF
ncbi:MAG: hypothetical protein NT096_16845 [Proteobacteria bacterium]|nr:hypothetical protein [Pseudomonadota bacterium]